MLQLRKVMWCNLRLVLTVRPTTWLWVCVLVFVNHYYGDLARPMCLSLTDNVTSLKLKQQLLKHTQRIEKYDNTSTCLYHNTYEFRLLFISYFPYDWLNITCVHKLYVPCWQHIISWKIDEMVKYETEKRI